MASPKTEHYLDIVQGLTPELEKLADDIEETEQFPTRAYELLAENDLLRLTLPTAHGGEGMSLIDYFPEEFLVIVDESHVTLPQVDGMYNADRSRKLTLVEHGFRLPSALDNRPLRFDEFERLAQKVIYVSATPGELRLIATSGNVLHLGGWARWPAR